MLRGPCKKDEKSMLPPGAAEIASVIGEKEAFMLMNRLGGTEKYYIPKKARKSHELVSIIGLSSFQKLVREMGGQEIDIPRGTFRKLKKVLILETFGTAREIARKLNVTQRYVRSVKSAAKIDPRQLFDWE